MQRRPEQAIPSPLVRGLAAAAGLLWAVATAGPAASAPEEAGSAPAPLDAVFVLDNSGSMRTHDPGRAAGRIVETFAAAMPRDGRLGVVLFDASARLVQPLTDEVGPGTRARWARIVQRVDYAGQHTNGPAGIERALYELDRSGRVGARKLVVFITDGIVDTGDPARDLEKTRWLKEELVDEARRAGVRIDGIAFTESADVELVQALALGTGGEYWRIERADEIPTVVARLGRPIDAAASRRAAAPAQTPAPHLPPVGGAADDGRSRGLLLLSAGLFVAVMLLLPPALGRWRRRMRPAPAAPPAPIGFASDAFVALPALPRGGRPPIVRLLDLSGATGRGEAVLLLDAPVTRIGRDPASEVAIVSDTVSSFHATIDYRDGYFHLEDQRSTNGTWLEGRRLEPHRPARLKSGDFIRIASHEFRFLIPDHEPRGRTAILGGTALHAVRVEPPSTSGGASGADPVGRHVAGFDRCLAAHLARIEQLGATHRRFVDRAFPPAIRALLVRRSQDLIERCRAEGLGVRVDVSKQSVHYTLCVVPESMDGARAWYEDRFGSYAKFLVGVLDARAGAAQPCEAVCVVTYGMVEEPWASVTIVPAREDGEAVEVMSLELLSEDQRREAEALDIVDVGRR